eukprot:XP_017950355.1 PREDICTED: fatty acid desaturase 1-like [Xenopus tropicalis]
MNKVFKRLRRFFPCFGKEEPTEEPQEFICLVPSVGSGNAVCQEEKPEHKMEPAIDNCRETPEIPDTDICQLGMKKKKYMPYNHQHKYFFFIGPPALIPVYSQWYIFYFAIRHKKWADLAWMISFYVRFGLCYIPFLGVSGTIALFMVV